MKKKHLTPVSIALQGLIVLNAGAFNSSSLYQHGPFSASSDITNGIATAQYSGPSVQIHKLIEDENTYLQWATDVNTVVTGTFVSASWTWNPSSYVDCHCEVWGENDPDSIAINGIQTPYNGAYSRIY
jgi:hypothetical protein